jgi:SAM-dependent methyltransferase
MIRAVPCPWCGHPLADGIRLGDRVRCVSCGVATTTPRPSEEELDAAYEGWYRPSDGRFSGIGDRLLRHLRGRLAVRIDRIAPPGPVLDVGSGDGALLAALRRRGREAVGLERESTEGARGQEISEIDKDDWAGVVFWHSLEHLREPGEAIERAAQLLRPRGLLFVAVPNSASFQARLFGDRWFALDIPRHLVHLTAPALVCKIEESGMKVERVSYTRGGQILFGWAHGIVSLLPGHRDLYDAIRRPEARSRPLSKSARLVTLGLGALVLPLAALGALSEVLARRGGTVYVEARRA